MEKKSLLAKEVKVCIKMYMDIKLLMPVFCKINSFSKCPFCATEKQISVKQNDKAGRGLCEKLVIWCLACGWTIKIFDTSRTLGNKCIDVNL